MIEKSHFFMMMMRKMLLTLFKDNPSSLFKMARAISNFKVKNYFSSINTIMQIRLQVFYLILSSIEIAQSAYVKYDDVINNKKGIVFWKSQKMSNFNKISIFQKSQFLENLIFSKISFCFQKYQQSNIFIKISFLQKISFF